VDKVVDNVEKFGLSTVQTLVSEVSERKKSGIFVVKFPLLPVCNCVTETRKGNFFQLKFDEKVSKMTSFLFSRFPLRHFLLKFL